MLLKDKIKTALKKSSKQVQQPLKKKTILKKILVVAVPTILSVSVAFFVWGGKIFKISKQAVVETDNNLNKDGKFNPSKKDMLNNKNKVPSVNKSSTDIYDVTITKQYGDAIKETSKKQIYENDDLTINLFVSNEHKIGENNKGASVGIEFTF